MNIWICYKRNRFYVISILLTFVFILTFLKREKDITFVDITKPETNISAKKTVQVSRLRNLGKKIHCKIPKLELWPKDIKKNGFKFEPVVCDSPESEWFIIRDRKIIFTTTAKTHILNNNVSCELRIIDTKEYLEGNSKFKGRVYDIKTYKNIENGMQIPSDIFSIHCSQGSNYVFENLYLTIKPNRNIISNPPKSDLSSEEPKWNILIWCFDSLSRLSWQRFLPKTVEAFKEIGGVWFERSNTIGYGTVGSFLPLLTGKHERELHQAVRGKKGARSIDDYPWIWKDLKGQNYSTLFADTGSFNWKHVGFNATPTDHYARPFFLAIKHHKKKHKKYCLKSKLRLEILQNYIEEYWDTYNKNPKMALVNYEEMSHDNFGDISGADKAQAEWLHRMTKSKRLENTIFILMSDHGARFGRIRKMKQSQWEILNPYYGIRLPDNFKKLHPIESNNLERNKDVLVTTLDIYATFSHIIRFVTNDKVKLRIHKRSASLLSSLPKNRTCAAANIHKKFCMCDRFKAISVTDTIVEHLTEVIIANITNSLKPIRQHCKPVKIKRILEAYKVQNNNGRKTGNKTVKEVYKVNFMVGAFYGQYESIVSATFDISRTAILNIEIQEVNRLDRYGSQAVCVERDYPELALFCYCIHQ
ncbi:unnamed protein product [Dimorphilus gyrociliatus]|uniref:Uncharacterized protein n=1 Tax=Dimorphilus gyrociliatus TaxID=2664684 RepID=A0A7I8W3H7_9ANNE|nr:unnamed protein product [Dimorphilus gyrociliatus]